MARKFFLSLVTLALLVTACTQQPLEAVLEEETMREEEMVDEEMEDESMMDEEMEDESMMDEEMEDDSMVDEEMEMHGATFTVRIENLSTSESMALPVLLAPGTWVVFKEGEPIFKAGEADRDLGLEALAEDGNPAELSASLGEYMGIISTGVFDTPVGAEQPGVAGPGAAFEFIFHGSEGEKFTFATMFVESNDLFYAPEGQGVDLFTEEGEPISGDLSSSIFLWDAGTEMNQQPGTGADQAPRQAGANTGKDEGGVVQLVEDMYTYPEGVIRVTITPEK
ncbi:MAG: hypothetical protein GTO14_11805 [Anaerolineales bacterium]|nr:hypothetical protein [Anaerolineales bacterium]